MKRQDKVQENARKPRARKNVVGISETCRKFMRADTNGSASSIDASIRTVLIPRASILAAMVSVWAVRHNEWVRRRTNRSLTSTRDAIPKHYVHTRVLLERASHGRRMPGVRALWHRPRRGGGDDIDACGCRCDQEVGEGIRDARCSGRIELNVECNQRHLRGA